jgi:hypothetical protein
VTDDIAWGVAVASWLVVISPLGIMIVRAYRKRRQRLRDIQLLQAYEQEFGHGFYKGQ